VWTDLFYAVERFIEGDRRDRMKKAEGKLTTRRISEVVAKHSVWLFIAWTAPARCRMRRLPSA
jgi:polyferredoxin